jgi:hypothetical protein
VRGFPEPGVVQPKTRIPTASNPMANRPRSTNEVYTPIIPIVREYTSICNILPKNVTPTKHPT